MGLIGGCSGVSGTRWSRGYGTNLPYTGSAVKAMTVRQSRAGEHFRGSAKNGRVEARGKTNCRGRAAASCAVIRLLTDFTHVVFIRVRLGMHDEAHLRRG